MRAFFHTFRRPPKPTVKPVHWYGSHAYIPKAYSLTGRIWKGLCTRTLHRSQWSHCRKSRCVWRVVKSPGDSTYVIYEQTRRNGSNDRMNWINESVFFRGNYLCICCVCCTHLGMHTPMDQLWFPLWSYCCLHSKRFHVSLCGAVTKTETIWKQMSQICALRHFQKNTTSNRFRQNRP